MNIALSVPQWTPYAPVRFAEEEGYFEEFGVEAEITAYGGGGEAQNALASGDEDIISFNGAGVALAVAKGVNQQIVSGEQIVPYGWSLNVRQEDGIDSMDALDGEQIGITSKGATTDVHALGAADDAGVSVETIPVGASGLISGLKEGQVTGSSTFPPLNFVAESAGWSESLYEFEQLGSTLPAVWVASQNTIDNDPEGVEGTLKAVFKATKYMRQNESEAIEYLKEYTGNPQAIAEKSFNEILMQVTTDGAMGTSEVDNALELAGLTGAEDLPAPDEMFTDQFLPIEVSV
jgi:NitT/TauT family transport system substrate-binding protein